MLYLLSCGFLSWTNRFSNLTTNTATSCSLLFAFFPRYSTWFLAFITYSATLSPLFCILCMLQHTKFSHFSMRENSFPKFYACFAVPPENSEQHESCFHPLSWVPSVASFALSLFSSSPRLPPCRASVLRPAKQILWQDLHHQQHDQD